jgi:hypothetical protein
VEIAMKKKETECCAFKFCGCCSLKLLTIVRSTHHFNE